MDPKQLRKILKEELKPIIQTQKQHTKTLYQHTKTLYQHTKTLSQHSRALFQHTKVLSQNSKTLETHSEKLDAITAELYQVHQLADTTLDVVKGRYEKNKREINEIKDHLGLPKEPYFGE